MCVVVLTSDLVEFGRIESNLIGWVLMERVPCRTAHTARRSGRRALSGLLALVCS